MVWEKQLKDIIIAAGFEIYDSEIKPHYIFTKPQSTESPQVNDTNSVSTYDYTCTTNDSPIRNRVKRKNIPLITLFKVMVMFGRCLLH